MCVFSSESQEIVQRSIADERLREDCLIKTFPIALAFATFLMGGASAETPRQGGTIRFTAPYGSSFASMDVHTTQIVMDQIWSRAIHRSLYAWDSAANKPRLELATEVGVSSDMLVYTYKLRDDAYFHHGRKMTADDIIWSYTRIMDGMRAFPGARYIRMIKGAVDVEKGLESAISGLRKIDDFTLEITLAEKVDPGYALLNHTTAIYPAEEGEKESFVMKPIGLGPFKFVEHTAGSRLVAERWEKYYRPGKPHADRLVISIMADAAGRDVAFRNKEIDATILGSAQYLAYKTDPELSKYLMEVPEMFTRYMGMNPKFPPFSDKRVRQAINYAIDSDLIIKKLVKEKAYRATSWLSPSSPAYGEDLKPYGYDPEKAKELLTEAGYPNGFTFEWSTTSNETGKPVVEAVLPMLEKVGIKARIQLVESAVLSDLLKTGQFQAFIWSSASGPDPQTTLRCFHSATPQSACNYIQYNNPAFDTLLDDAGKADDPAIKLDLLTKANALLQEEAPFWFFNYNKAVMAHQPWLHGLQKNATELGVQSYEDLWIDETSPAAK